MLIFLIIKFGFIIVFNKIKFERINKLKKSLKNCMFFKVLNGLNKNKNIRLVVIKIVFNVLYNYKIVMLYYLIGYL